jgi:phosphoenolpyruvate carboxykinase (ATP)
LTPQQAMYHFLSGYTAKVAGTERGVKEPTATFSACFGAPFLPLEPCVYAKLFGEKVSAHRSRVWLVNTGWTGGPFGSGRRISLPHTRAILAAALSGELDGARFRKDPLFNVEVPLTSPGVPPEILDPRSTWPSAASYDQKARELAALFAENFRQFEGNVPAEVRAAGPRKD